jgi:hypothetical protein
MRRAYIGLPFLAVLAVCALWVMPAGATGGKGATISGSFADSCRNFMAHSSKDISFVELHYVDGRVVRDETTASQDHAVDGEVGDEIEFALVKSSTTKRKFTCARASSPPAAILEIETPPLSECTINDTDHPTCDADAPRTGWSRPPGGVLGFIFNAHGALTPLPFALDFRGTSSSDPDGDIASWSIDFGDGTSTSGSWLSSPPAEVQHAYAQPFFGPSFPTVTLTVTDAAGQSDSDAITLVGIDGAPD